MFIKKVTFNSFSTPRFFFYLGLLTIGQTVFRPAFSFTVSDWFFLTSLFFSISESLLRRKIEIRFQPFMILGIFLFAIGGIISSCFSKIPLHSFIALMKYLYLIIAWFWLSTILLQKPEQIRIAIVLWTSSAAISSIGSLIQLIWSDIIPGTYSSWSRMAGLTEHVNDLGGLTSISLIPAIMMLTHFQKTTWRSIYYWLCVMLIFIGLVLSVSISAIFSMLVSLIVWLTFMRFTHKKFVILIIITFLFLTVIYFQSSNQTVSIISRYNDISDNRLYSSSLQTRLDTYVAAWESIKESPYIGVGMASDSSFTVTGYVVHNIFLLNWFESGLFGLIGIVIILSSVAFKAYKGIADPCRKQSQFLGIALLSSFIAFITFSNAQPIYYKRYGWISAALIIALYSSRKFTTKAV